MGSLGLGVPGVGCADVAKTPPRPATPGALARREPVAARHSGERADLCAVHRARRHPVGRDAVRLRDRAHPVHSVRDRRGADPVAPATKPHRLALLGDRLYGEPLGLWQRLRGRSIVADPDRLFAGLVLYQLGQVMFLLPLLGLVPLLVLLFPTGRLPSRRWRPPCLPSSAGASARSSSGSPRRMWGRCSSRSSSR